MRSDRIGINRLHEKMKECLNRFKMMRKNELE